MADPADTAPQKQEKPYVLRGEEAMALWRAGQDKWNAWSAAHPDAIVDFSKAEFEADEEGKIDFSGFHFPAGEGDVNFSNATFGEGYVSFFHANFGEGNVNFYNANFGEGDVYFSSANFGEGDVHFQDCNFEGPARFLDLRSVDRCTQFSFEGARFEQLFTFSHIGMLGCPLDLRRTKLAHDVVVNDVTCDFALKEKAKGWSLSRLLPAKARKREDSQRFRRLKELAVANRNHAKALEFHAQEIRSKRGHETNWWQDLLQLLFWGLGDYGRSVARPIAGLFATLFGFAGIFWWLRTPFSAFELEQGESATRSFATAITYASSNLLSFIPNGRTARSQGEEKLFGGETPDLVLMLGGLESVIAVILLFLLGLALRNQFRV